MFSSVPWIPILPPYAGEYYVYDLVVRLSSRDVLTSYHPFICFKVWLIK